MTPASKPVDRWSMDFVHDQLADGRRIRVFAVIDDFTRQSVGVAVGTSLTSSHVAVALDQAIAEYGCPRRLVCDNGTEFTSLVFQQWAARRGIDVQFIEPGKPNQNAFAESFQRSLPRRVPQHPLASKPG